jgi:hypothetical protein
MVWVGKAPEAETSLLAVASRPAGVMISAARGPAANRVRAMTPTLRVVFSMGMLR